jgi:DNA-binding transcriptional ArsR family regulator
MARENLLSIIRSEIEERLDALRPVLAEHEQLLGALSALDANRESAAPQAAKRTTARVRVSKSSKQKRAPRGAAREAILAALEHGSHTVGELVVVTAMTGPNVNGNLRRLLAEGAIAKTDREGKTAYTLSG